MTTSTTYTMKSIATYAVGGGSHPTVSMNNESTIVVGWASTASTNLYYKVGVADADGQAWQWGGQDHYDGGNAASLAVNNSNVVVDVHRSSTGSNNLFCRVGAVDVSSRSISWGESIKFDGGGDPYVSLNDNNRVIAVWSSTNSTNLYYRSGTVDPLLRTITWEGGHKFSAGSHPTVSINNNNVVIFGWASTASTKLLYQVGSLASDGTLFAAPSVEYGNGDHDCFTIDDSNLVWESHKSSNSNTSYYAVGTLITNTPVWTVSWDSLDSPHEDTSKVIISMPPGGQSENKNGVSILLNGTDLAVNVWLIGPVS